jgi:DNA-binding beta-propeller fold protein YncE
VEKDQLIAADDSSSSVLTYKSQFPATDRITEPIRNISGPKTRLGFVCGVAISPENKELYAVSGEHEYASVFPLEASGDVAPLRRFVIEHGAADIFLDSVHDELFITDEHINKLSAFRRTAEGDEKALRFIQGPHTGLADPQRVYVDTVNDEVLVTNHGSWRLTETGEPYISVVNGNKNTALAQRPSTGKFLDPSINIYSRTANGDAPPLRIIQGPKTGLNVPLGVYVDHANGQIVVANSGDSSILFFDRTASGDVAPSRAIKGTATGLAGPSGMFIDTKRNELWVGNWDNHTATVYAINAQGNVKPLRALRSAPKGTRFAGFGNIGDVGFDSKRQEILVPN